MEEGTLVRGEKNWMFCIWQNENLTEHTTEVAVSPWDTVWSQQGQWSWSELKGNVWGKKNPYEFVFVEKVQWLKIFPLCCTLSKCFLFGSPGVPGWSSCPWLGGEDCGMGGGGPRREEVELRAPEIATSNLIIPTGSELLLKTSVMPYKKKLLNNNWDQGRDHRSSAAMF